MNETVVVTAANIDDFFQGIMLRVEEPFIGFTWRPGWRCRACGWQVGCADLPPSHSCPEDGEARTQHILY